MDSRITKELGETPPAKGLNMGFLDIVLILLERKWVLFIGLIIISILAIIYSLTATSLYTATATILPSKQSLSSPLALLGGDLPVGNLLKSLDMGGEQNDRFESILDSRPLADRVIQRFNLIHVYKFDKKKKYYYEDVLKAYNRNVKYSEDDLDNIHVAVTDSSPQMAADMANYVLQVLDSIAFDLNRQSARGSRLFFESRLALEQNTLDSIHQAFADFQIQNNLIDLDQQVKASIDALAPLEAQGMALDVEKGMLSANFGNNDEVQEIENKRTALSKSVQNYLENGNKSLVLPLKKTPQLGIQYMTLYRDVKVQESLYAFLLQMYEEAKFREANNAPLVTVLEKAEVPQKRISPKRSIICLLSFFVGFALLSLYILLAKFLEVNRRRQTVTYAKLKAIRRHFSFKK